MVKTELYFGLSVGNVESLPKYTITEKEFYSFLEASVMSRFDGFTVIRGLGVWKREVENCVIVIILWEGRKAEDFKIERIRSDYMRLFEQESVMRLDFQVDQEYGAPIL